MKKIVIIDDEQGVIEALEAALSLWDFEGIGVTKPDQSLDVIRQQQPVLILLDLLLSGVEGPEVAKKIQTVPDNKNIPIVLMSAHPTAKIEAEKMHAAGFLSKPFDLDQLHTLITQVLKK